MKRVDCLAARGATEQLEIYYVPLFGRLFGAQGAYSAPKGANIRDLGGKACHCTQVWEYRDIGRLFISGWGGERVIIGWWR